MLQLNLSTSFWHKKSTVDCGAWIIPWFLWNTSTSRQLLRSKILIMNFLCDLLKVLHVSATNIIKYKFYALNVKQSCYILILQVYNKYYISDKKNKLMFYTYISMVLSLMKSQWSGFSTSTTPHGYIRPLTFLPLTSITVLAPITAKGTASYKSHSNTLILSVSILLTIKPTVL